MLITNQDLTPIPTNPFPVEYCKGHEIPFVKAEFVSGLDSQSSWE